MNLNEMDTEELIFAKMVNDHHDEIRKNILANSLKQEEIQYNRKKNVNSKKWRDAVIAILIVITLLYGGKKVVDALETKDVDQRISYYYSVMDHSRDYDKNQGSIENFVKENPDSSKHSDPIVSYEPWNQDNFVNYVVEASKADNPVTEVRCALIAAYNVINEQFREEQFNILFNKLKTNEEFINNTGFDVDKTDIWQMLGYKDRMDFQLNARKDTKELELINKRSNNGKGM